MTAHRLGTRVLIYALLGLTSALGLPLFHYVTALMIALLLRHGRSPDGVLTSLGTRAARTA